MPWSICFPFLYIPTLNTFLIFDNKPLQEHDFLLVSSVKCRFDIDAFRIYLVDVLFVEAG